MDATPVLLLFQVPNNVGSLSVVVEPTQTFIAPVIPDGNGKIVNGMNVEQPVGNV